MALLVNDEHTTTAEADPPREDWGWTRRQRIGLGTLLAALIAFLVIGYRQRPAPLQDGPLVVGGETLTLPQRIDPNTATLEELARLPHIGEITAGKIITYRDARKATAADGIVFRAPSDLDSVPGVGKKLIEQMEPFLEFPDDANGSPATKP
jgi:hypothetical protein